MEKIENLFYSLAPLIVIIILSWVFSRMGARARRQAASRQTGPEPQAGDGLMEMLMGKKGEEMPLNQEQDSQSARHGAGPTPIGWETQRMPSGAQPTPKPITPRWWGA